MSAPIEVKTDLSAIFRYLSLHQMGGNTSVFDSLPSLNTLHDEGRRLLIDFLHRENATFPPSFEVSILTPLLDLIDKKDEFGNTVLMHSIRQNDYLMTALIIKFRPALINQGNQFGEYPIHIAASVADPNIIGILLDASLIGVVERANPDIQVPPTGNTAAHLATAKANFSCLLRLQTAKANFHLPNRVGLIPRDLAIINHEAAMQDVNQRFYEMPGRYFLDTTRLILSHFYADNRSYLTLDEINKKIREDELLKQFANLKV